MKKLTSLLTLAFALLLASAGHAQLNDSFWDTAPGSCSPSVSANIVVLTNAGVGTGLVTTGTGNAAVSQAASSAAATHTWGCELTCAPSRTASAKGCTIFGFAWYYGIQTTTATSMGAPVCQINTFPNPAASETISTVAGVNIPLTAQPLIASANLTAGTAGQFFTQYLVFTTPQALNGPYQKIFCSLTLVQGGAAAMVSNTPGGTVFGVNTVF